MADTPPSDALKKLVRFIVILAIVATIVATLVYLYVILPAKTGHVPTNGDDYCWTNGNWGLCLE